MTPSSSRTCRGNGHRIPIRPLRGSWTALSLADDRAVAAAVRARGSRVRDPRRPGRVAGRGSPAQLRLAGGGTLAAGWRQLLADVLGLPLYAVDVPAASGRGAALLGAHAAGLLSFDDIAGPLAPPAALAAEPDPAMTAFHADRHDRFRRAVSVLRSAGGPAEEGTA